MTYHYECEYCGGKGYTVEYVNGEYEEVRCFYCSGSGGSDEE